MVLLPYYYFLVLGIILFLAVARFRRRWRSEQEQQAAGPGLPPSAERMMERAHRNIAAGQTEQAIVSLESYTGLHPYDPELKALLGKLYAERSDLVNAGRHWYLLDLKEERYEPAIQAFRRRYGHDPMHVLKCLLGSRNHLKLTVLDPYALSRLEVLLEETIDKHGIVPRFARNLQAFLEKQTGKQ